MPGSTSATTQAGRSLCTAQPRSLVPPSEVTSTFSGAQRRNHTFASESADPDTTSRPLGENTSDVMAALWPWNSSTCPSRKYHRIITPSAAPSATAASVGEKAVAMISPVVWVGGSAATGS